MAKQVCGKVPNLERLKAIWRDIVRIYPHYPKGGIAYVDPESLWAHPDEWEEVMGYLTDMIDPESYDVILAIAVRGVPVATGLELAHHKSMVIARKPENGKSKIPPGYRVQAMTSSEYGKDVPIEFNGRYIKAAQRVLIVDDLMATGGTASSLIEALTRKCGAKVAGVAVLTHLRYLSAVAKGVGCPVYSVFNQEVRPTLPDNTADQTDFSCPLE